MPEEPLKPVGQLTKVDRSELLNIKPQGELTPVGKIKTFIPHIDDFNPNPSDNTDKVESVIDFLAKDVNTKGGLIDVDKDVLRDLMRHPNATQDQIKESIATMQSGNTYYLKNENGVMVPKQLKEGQKPPKGYNVQSIWGTQKEANDDSWYTDLGKSLANGVVGAVEGVADLGQLATMGITGESSDALDATSNTLNSLKFTKDEDLNKSIYNTEGVQDWGDLVSKDRFDLSPSALWGTLNMAAESVTSFVTGAGAAGQVAKGAQGVAKLAELTKGAKSAAAFTGSFLTQLGDNLDNAREAGLDGREAAAFASITTSAQAAIDAKFGLDAQIFKNVIGKSEKELMKGLAQTIEKDAEGKITEEGFKQLAKGTTLGYGSLVKAGIKEVGADAFKEAGQEASQDFVAKSAENLWDKFSDEYKDRFGTDATSAKSFASYIQNGLAGLVAGVPMGVLSASSKKKYNEQSIDALKVVEGGKDKIDEFKANVHHAARKGDITEQERDRAIFKIDTYDKYNEQVKDLPNMSKEDKKEVFELSFNIEGLKSEINIPKEDIDKLDPIAVAKIDNKKKIINDLQKELNHILLKQDIVTETKVPQKTVEDVAKDLEPDQEATTLNKLFKDLGVPTKVKAEKTDIGSEEKPNERTEKRNSVPKFDAKDDNGKYEFNKLSDPLKKKQAIHDYFDENPDLKNQLDVKIEGGQNNVWSVNLGNDRYIKFARSVVPDKYTGENKNFPSNERRRDIGDSAGNPHYVYDEPVGLRLEEIKSDGKFPRKRVINIYNKQTGKHIAFGKELDKGSSKYSPFEVKQLEQIISKDNTTAFTPPTKVEMVKEEKKEPIKETVVKKEIYSVPSSNIGKSEKIEVSKEVYDKWEKVDEKQKEDIDALKKYGLNSQELSSRKREIAFKYAAEKRKILGTETSKELKKELVKEKEAKGESKKVKKYTKINESTLKNGDKAYIKVGNDYSEATFVRKSFLGIPITRYELEGGGVYPVAQPYKLDITKELVDPKKVEAKEVVKERPKTTTVESKEVKAEDVEVSQVEKDHLLNEGYDNATIDKAVKESNALRKLPAKELFNKLKEKGIFNLGTTGNLEFRPNVGLSAEEYNTTLKQLENGKEIKTAERLLNFVEDVKETGTMSMIGMTGGKSEKYNMPLHQFLLEEKGERGLSEEEEVEELEKYSARKQYEETVPEGGQYQKVSNVKGDITKVVERIKKVLPKVNIVFDTTLIGKNGKPIAGHVVKNTLRINPDYAGLDSPIHEAGHILIDAIGYNNKVIQSAIKQLKTTDLWAETKERYLELNEEMLGKEVLAEAIGREGAGIFDKVAAQNQFKALLNYIFDILKQLLGLDKNIAKSLAKQIISGIKTSELKGKNEDVQEQRPKGSYFDIQLKEALKKLAKEKNLTAYSAEELTELYNAVFASNLSKAFKDKGLNDIMRRIAIVLKEKAITESGKKLDEDNVQKDISWIDKWFKVLSHFSDSFPEMKELSKLWNSAFFAKMKESKAEKRTHDKLALEVINERNKKLGIKETAGRLAGQLISENRHKYFDFLDNGKGKLITLEEAKKKGLSKSQIEYLKYSREKLAERDKIKTDIYDVDMDVLRLDKGFSEAYKTEGIVSAIGSLLGTSSLSNIKLDFTDPNTGKTSQMDFIDIQNALVKYGEKGIKEKAKSLLSLFKYTVKAAKKRTKKGGEYLLNEEGDLQSRFNRPVDERKSYSKDFYGALNQYIDDSAHIKHISPLIPIINSIEYLNSKDVFDTDGKLIGEQKKNLVEWIDKWRKLHVLGQSEETQPEIDKALRLLRFMTSGITMWFNVPANILNVAIGNYNTWRQENSETWAKGQKRLFGGTDRKVTKEYGYGVLNRYAADIVRKYSGVSNDQDSNPIQTTKNFFAQLGFLGQSWGEFQIQGSGLLGLMSDEDYNSFEYKTNKHGVEELVVKKELNGKPIDEKALESRILANIDKVSDVQGKYSEKDRRNIQNNEMGKIAMQFKQWTPDAFRIRYGSDGSWRKMVRGGFAELRNDIKEKGKVKAFWENKDFMRNMKGLMATGLLMSLVYQDDDDKEKSFTAKLFQRALADVLFVFDPDNLKFTITKPVAAIGTIEKLINIGDHMFAFETDDYYKSDSKYGKKGDSKLRGDVTSLLPAPGKKAVELLNEEE